MPCPPPLPTQRLPRDPVAPCFPRGAAAPGVFHFSVRQRVGRALISFHEPRWTANRAVHYLLGPIPIMKKRICTWTIALLTTRLLAPPVSLTVSEFGGSNLHIITSSIQGSLSRGVVCVLEGSADLKNWTAMSTNHGPFPLLGGMATNVVQVTNALRFYRAYVK